MNPQNTTVKTKDVKFLFSGCGANLRALEGGTEGASREQLFEFLWHEKRGRRFLGLDVFPSLNGVFSVFPSLGVFSSLNFCLTLHQDVFLG